MDSNFKNSEAVLVRFTYIPLIFSVFFWLFDIYICFSLGCIDFQTGDGRNKENSRKRFLLTVNAEFNR